MIVKHWENAAEELIKGGLGAPFGEDVQRLILADAAECDSLSRQIVTKANELAQRAASLAESTRIGSLTRAFNWTLMTFDSESNGLVQLQLQFTARRASLTRLIELFIGEGAAVSYVKAVARAYRPSSENAR